MIGFVKDLVEDQNGNIDEFRVYTLLSFLSLICTQMHDVYWLKHVFNPQSFGLGLGALLGAAAAGIGFKSSRGV